VRLTWPSICLSFAAIRRIDKGIELFLDIEKLITPNGIWPKSAISLKKIYNDKHDTYRYIASASYINLDDVDSILSIFPTLSDKVALPQDIDITGILKNSVIKYDPTLDNNEQIYIDAEFSHLGGQFNDPPVNIYGLNGQVQGTQREGNIHIESSSVELEPGKFQVEPLTFYELNTELNWQFKKNNLILTTELLDTHTKDFDLQLKGKLEFNQNKKSPFVDILLELSNGEVDKIADYLPARTSVKGIRWIRNSFITGNIPYAEFVFSKFNSNNRFNVGIM